MTAKTGNRYGKNRQPLQQKTDNGYGKTDNGTAKITPRP
jgi:hypothetical protein